MGSHGRGAIVRFHQAGQIMSDHVLYEFKDGVGRITFNLPEARNAFTLQMYERLEAICQQAGNDPSVRVLVLTGAGDKAFAAGTDISEFKTFSTAQHALDYEVRMDRVLTKLERLALPTIASIAGVCTGGGATIAACCDLRIGAANARFGVPIARTLGNCLSIANYARFAALVGPARVKDIIFSARLVEAAEAHSIGLLNEVLPDYASLQSRTEELARLVASQAPLTLRVTKEALLRIREKMTPEDDPNLTLKCYMSRDFREGMDAFLNKRAPNWKGI
jgi:enoyl-CoA hydratase/carnithine racemase